MNALVTSVLALVVVAVTEAVKRIRTKDYVGLSHIIVAAVAGTLAGLTKIDGLTVVTGLSAGLAAVGLHTTVSQIGG